MTINNTSRYASETVRNLIQFAASQLPGLELKGVHVNVKNTSRNYRGRAYPHIPRISNAPPGSKYLMVVAIGKPQSFPCDNMVKTYKWMKIGEGENAKRTKVIESHPYGGKKSPHIVHTNWQEALVSIAAHEFTHIHQYQNKQPRSEVACEKRALKALEAFRNIHIYSYDTLAR